MRPSNVGEMRRESGALHASGIEDPRFGDRTAEHLPTLHTGSRIDARRW
jgi:hypothetical protein